MAGDLIIKAGKIHRLTRQSIESGNKIIIHKGGTGSGKTFDLMIYAMMTFAMRNYDTVSTVVSESKPHLDIGCIRYAKRFVSAMNEKGETGIKWNESKSFYTFDNGSIFEFFSADRIDKALGARRDLLYGNEINSLKLPIWSELARRSDTVLGDFNPTSKFWLEDWLNYQEKYDVIKSNHTFNKYLPDNERRKIELQAERDLNFKRIHIDCEYGIYEGLVFTEWQQVDTLPEGKEKFGMDFGYTNDPTTLIKVIDTSDAYYLDEMLYQVGMTNRDIANTLRSLGLRPNYDEIIADSAEPKSIDEIRLHGFNVKPAAKGKDSIKAGIDKLKSKRIYVTKRSVNLIKELRNYSWVTDKTGQSTNKPIDAFNHAIDAARYAISRETQEIFII